MALNPESVVVELEAKIDGYTSKVKQAAGTGEKAFQQIGKAANDAERQTTSSMGKSAAAAERAISRIVRAARSAGGAYAGFADDIKKGLADAKNQAEQAGSSDGVFGRLRSLAGGFLAGLSVGKLVDLTRQSLEYAGSLAQVSKQLGVTTEQLQVLRFGADQASVSQTELDQGLLTLNKSLGEAALGSKEDAKLFKALGVSVKDANGNVKSAGEALPQVADALKQIADPAKRAAVETRLFGEAGQRLDTLLSGGSARIDELTSAARALGIVLSQDQIENADRTATKLTELKTVLAANISGVIADNASSIYDLANSLVRLAASIPGAIQQWQLFRAQMAIRLADEIDNSPLGILPDSIKGTAGPRADAQRTIKQVQDQQFRQKLSRAGLLVTAGSSLFSKPQPTPKVGDLSNLLARDHSARTPKSHGPTEEEIRERFVQELQREKQEQLQIEAGLTKDATLAGAKLNDAEEAKLQERIAQISRDKHFSVEQKGELVAQARITSLLRSDVISHETNSKLIEEELALGQARLDIERDLLNAKRSQARTPGQARAIDLALLDNQRRATEAHLNDVIGEEGKAHPRFSPNEIDIAKTQLAALPAQIKAQTNSIIHDTLTPLQEFLDRIPKGAEEVNVALQSIEAEGLKSLNDGIADAIVNGKSLGAVFHQVAGQIISDLIRIALQQAELSIFKPKGGAGGILGALSKAIGLAGGGTNFGTGTVDTSGMFDFGAFGRASGGYVAPGQLVRVNEGSGAVEGFRPQGSGTVIPLGQMNAARPGGTTVIQHFTLQAPNSILANELVDFIEQKSQQAAQAGAQGGYAAAREDMANLTRTRM